MLKAQVIVGIGLLLAATSSWADTSRLAQAASVPTGPGVGTAAITNLRGTITAIDREKKTVTVTGEQGRRVVLDVHQPATFDAIKVGDPVVAKYMETVVIQARKAGTATPGVKAEAVRVPAKPGGTPGGTVAREITVTATITAIDRASGTVTLRGPQGDVDTVQVKDRQMLQSVREGDLVEVTVAQALAVSLDRSAP
jgi:hypothetical protein